MRKQWAESCVHATKNATIRFSGFPVIRFGAEIPLDPRSALRLLSLGIPDLRKIERVRFRRLI